MTKPRLLLLSVLAATAMIPASDASITVAYWNQNSNDLPNGGFGFQVGDFPQAADQGSGTITLGTLIQDTVVNGNGDTVYERIVSFAGSTINAQPSVVSGGSFSIQGGVNTINNGKYFDINVTLSGLTDPVLSWATQRTGSGFSSYSIAYSTDSVLFTTEFTENSIPTSFALRSYDFSGVSALDNASNVTFRVTLDGATGTTGNIRLDNITVTAVPEPTSALLLGAGLLTIALRRRK